MMNLSQWAEFISKMLEEFANIEFQRRVWLWGEGPEVSSLDEAINLLFDHFEGFLDLPEISSNQKLCSVLNEIYLALKAITDNVMTDSKMNLF